MSLLPIEKMQKQQIVVEMQEPQTKLATASLPPEVIGRLANNFQGVGMEVESSADPPLEIAYKNVVEKVGERNNSDDVLVVEEGELPLIDMKQLGAESEACKKLIAEASKEWGFFQVINHGVSEDVLQNMRSEQVKLLRKPFHEKIALKELSYRWGTPSPTRLDHLSWSEAFHVHLTDIFHSKQPLSLRSSMEQFALAVGEVAIVLAEILAEEIGRETDLFKESCLPENCFLRLNRYPACPTYSHMMGLMHHTDTSFLTLLHQDHVGGLQLLKHGKWIAVKPNPQALIINIGDLFQAWSNKLYKSVEHRVVANAAEERFSAAYFLCPPNETVIESGGVGGGAAVYRSFTFGEFKKQIEVDVKSIGQKVGLPRFLLPTH